MNEPISGPESGAAIPQPIPNLPGKTGRPAPAEDPSSDAFLKACAATLLDPKRQSERGPLIRFLNDTGALSTLVADCRFVDASEAVSIAQMAVGEHPDFHEKLLAVVEGANADSQESVDRALRCLRVLEYNCPREQLVLRLLDIKPADARVRSKITLIVGRLTQSPKWLMERLKDQDPRVRANAVEGLWASNFDGLEAMYQEASRDPHHRIAANAAFGLYSLGDPTAVSILYSMLRHDGELFRRAALWAVSRVGDSRYEGIVASIAGSGLPEEREIAERLLKLLAEHRAAIQFRSSLSVKVAQLTSTPGGDWVAKVQCLAPSSNRWLSPPDVSALNFIVIQDGIQIESYSLRGLPPVEPLCAVTVVPAHAGSPDDYLVNAWRGAGDTERIGVICYHQSASQHDTKNVDEPLPFGNRIESLLDQAKVRAAPMLDLNGAIEKGLRALGREAGKRLLFAVVPPDIATPASLHLSATAAQFGVQFHGIVSRNLETKVADSFRALAELTGGACVLAETAESLCREVLSARADHFGSIEISWRATGPAPSHVTIICSCRLGYGETQFPSRSSD